MSETTTAGAQRALDRAAARALRRGASATEPLDLLAALADEPESRAGTLLALGGLDGEALARRLGTDAEPPDLDADGGPTPTPSADLRAVLGDAGLRARAAGRGRPIGTEHLLLGLFSTSGPVAELLSDAGLAPETLVDRVEEPETGPIPLGDDLPAPELADPFEAADLARLLDASANRAGEGLRVVEDYARFALDHPGLTRRLKEVRHRLAEAVRGLGRERLLSGRDTPGDVGAHVTTPAERIRENPRAVLLANFRRTTEALRSLEEYAKLLDVWVASRFESLRYDVYTLEKLALSAVAARRTLGDTRLYVLVGGQATLGDLNWLVEEALDGGAGAIQLREKGLSDRTLLEHAQAVRRLTARAGAAFLLNDRSDLARVVGADGVHLGQEDLPPREARRVVGPNAVLGLSTHNAEQLEAAALSGANYLGVGPVYSTPTKAFPALAGLTFVREAAERSPLPWFAIGGITLENLDEVLEAGARRVAVSSAVTRANRPRDAAAAFRTRLDAAAS